MPSEKTEEPPPSVSEGELWVKLHDLIARQVQPAILPIAPKSDFVTDLGFDSMDTIEFTMAVEEEFGIEIPDEEVEKMKKVEDLLRYLEEKTQRCR